MDQVCITRTCSGAGVKDEVGRTRVGGEHGSSIRQVFYVVNQTNVKRNAPGICHLREAGDPGGQDEIFLERVEL